MTAWLDSGGTGRFFGGAVAGLTIGLLSAAGFRAIAAPPPLAPVLREDSISRVARQRTASVVFLHTVSANNPAEEGSGSGVVIDVDGLILTNAHVIEGSGVVHVRAADGAAVETTAVGADADLDLTLLRPMRPLNLPVAPLGDSDALSVGDIVIAIGNPLGLHHTVTSGIISAKARSIGTPVPFLQTDTAMNPGSSGGALFDLRGRLVGITTGILSERGQNVGLNVAIPINVVRAALPRLGSPASRRRLGEELVR